MYSEHSKLFTDENLTTSCYGDHVCDCGDAVADCSANHGKLTYLPKLNVTYNSYRYLNLSNNSISSIANDFFHNVSKEVEAIDLYNNGLIAIADGAFGDLDKLNTLLLGGSRLLGDMDLRWLLSLPPLINISLGCSNIGFHLNMSNFRAPFLTELFLGRNEIVLLETSYFPAMQSLNLNTNRLYDFPKTCSSSNEPLFPNLENLYLDTNMIQCIDDPVCLPNLTRLSLRYNNIKYFTANLFSISRFHKLKYLILVQMENKISRIEPFFINNSAVLSITFALNNVNFSMVNDNAFGGCTSVVYLDLSGNNFRDVKPDHFRNLLTPMERSLKSLHLGKTQLQMVSSRMFRGLNLTQLYLFRNHISLIPDGTFDNLKYLRTLELDNNNIVTVSENAFGSKLRAK